MPLYINANYEGWFAQMAKRGHGLTREGKRLLLREANRWVVDRWHRYYIPRHFSEIARSRYHYQQRKPRYRGIKQDLAAGQEVFVNGQKLEPEPIKKGGRVDIVRSGSTEASANAQTAIHATATGAKTRVVVPSYVLKRRAGQPDQKRELQKLTRAERSRLSAGWRAKAMRGARLFGSRFRLKRRLGSRSGSI